MWKLEKPILDVVGKPDDPLTLVRIDSQNGDIKYRDKAGKIYWLRIDSLNNEIWYTERK